MVNVTNTAKESPPVVRRWFALTMGGIALVSMPDQIRIIEAKFGSGIVPDSMLTDAPQAALVSAEGVIILTPTKEQTMRDFLSTKEFRDGS